jgi:hypothetical protein
MEPERQEYKGHRIELRAREDERLRAAPPQREGGLGQEGLEQEELGQEELEQEELELLIDDRPVRYGRLPDGRYALHEYAYDWQGDLIDLAQRFIDYRDKAEEIRREAESGGET